MHPIKLTEGQNFYSKCQISSFQSFYSVVYPLIMYTLDDLHLLHVLILASFSFFSLQMSSSSYGILPPSMRMGGW